MTDGLSPVSDPSDLTFPRRNLDEAEEEADSDTNDTEKKAMPQQYFRILCNTNGMLLEKKQ
ncbi:hypothetical protein MDA_GLEAN10010937 [Myotis davidii]|uniref:Uncharacterized protein n=1 Tax=Myotis davidii TaxID=225400 RepID=L5LWD7_MYODS|nr:hypothetical protein MDA_GLEAN10010937 [Myotis davidii]